VVELEDKSCKSIGTLKAWIVGELKVIEEKFKALEAADKLLREQNRIHFEGLNNEGRRITSMTERTVSQDTWTGFIKQYEERHSALQRVSDNAVSKEEFQSYRTATERALTLKAGQTQGIGQVGTIVLGFFVILSSLASVAALLIALFRH
jgi:hypothetical protein